MDDKEFSDFLDEKYAELDSTVRDRAVKHLKDNLDPQTIRDVRTKIAQHGSKWIFETSAHFGWGMAIRNLLRSEVKDKELPSGNWDDYYQQVVEVAAGTRQ